jgi:proton-translocating NADH-quinone oxidoreductase chain N
MTNFDIIKNSFETILPEFFFINAILIILLFGTLYNASVKYKYPILTYSIGYLSIQSILITLFLIINSPKTGPTSIVIFNNVLIMDDFTLFVKIIVLLGTLATLLISFNYTLNQKMSARICEYMILILFSTLSMLLLISSFDLISMYLAIELQSLSFYVLAAFQRNNEFSTEAGLKYFILGALASGLLLFGESIIYGFTGLTNFEELTKLIAVIPEITQNMGSTLKSMPNLTFWTFSYTYIEILIIGLFFILVAFLFKISAVPFHLWTPDVYEGAPTSVTAFFSITPKIAVLALLLRLCMYTFYDLIESWQYLIIFSSFLSMFIGTLGAINQNKIKRLLAYSSIAHVGYILISLATGTIESIEALLIYVVLYTLTILNIFSILLASPTINITESCDIYLPQTNFQPTSNYLNLHYLNNIDTQQEIKIIPNLPNHLIFSTSKFKWFQNPYQNFKLCYTSLLLGNPCWDPYFTLKQSNLKPIEKENKNFSTSMYNFLNNNRSIQKALFFINSKKNMYTNWNHSIFYIKHITDLSSLAKTNPILAFTAAMVFFSNAGIPPLAGFYGKLNVFLTAVENSMYFLALSGILCSVIGAFYSIRLVKIIYFHSMSNETWPFYQPISKENAIVLALTFFFTLFFFLAPSFLFITAHSAALSLCL